MRSNNLYFRVSGAVGAAAAFAPRVFACISYLTRGGFETDEDLLNRAVPAPEIDFKEEPAVATPEVRPTRHEALPPATIPLRAGCAMAGGVLVWRLRPPAAGQYL